MFGFGAVFEIGDLFGRVGFVCYWHSEQVRGIHVVAAAFVHMMLHIKMKKGNSGSIWNDGDGDDDDCDDGDQWDSQK